MRNLFKISTFLLLVLGVVGCGSSSTNGGASSSLIVETQKSTINEAKDTMGIDFSVINNYDSRVGVNLSSLDITVTPCKVEDVTFEPNEIILDENITEKRVHAKVIFKEECTPTSYLLKGTTLLSLEGRTNEINFGSAEQELIPDKEPTTVVGGVSVDGNNTDIDNVLPIVVIPSSLRKITLKSNSKSTEIPIHVFKDIAPYTKGTVKVELPSKVLNGIDVGSFSSFEVPVNEQGVAIFKYTGPSNLKALLNANDKSSVFKFYHSANSDEKSRQKIVVNYSVSADTYIPIDYSLSIDTENDFSMGIPNLQKTFKVVLKDTNGNIINDNEVKIEKIVVKTENALVAKILDTTTGNMVDSLELRKENNSAFILKSKKLSGIVPIKVTINFKDINGKDTELSTNVSVRVMSGPPSAISVSYVGTSQDKERAKYEEKFAISVTDEYGNKVNTQPYISVGAIVGYAVDGKEASSVESSTTKRLYYGQSSIESSKANGVIDTLGDEIANTTHFEDTTNTRSDVFQWVNSEGKNSDKLVIFGKGKNYEAMGKWDFTRIDNNTLSLEDDYFGIDRGELSYAIGRNYYQDQCLDDGREWIGSTDSDTYQIDEEGTVIVSYKYDYHLTGKDALIWVNLNGYQADTGKNTRIGEVTKHTLRGMGLDSRPSAGYSIDKNSTASVSFDIHHTNAPEWYHNGHFGYEVETTCPSFNVIDSINNHDARSCDNGGVAYVTFSVTAPKDASCNFNIKDILVADEF